jgi:hypothetical protein
MMKKLDHGVNQLWPSPVYKTSITKEDCESLLTMCLESQNIVDPDGDATSNLIETSDLLKRIANEKFSEFFKEVYSIDLENYNVLYKAWLTGSTNGYSMETHNHSGSPFVAVFYVLSEHTEKGGELVITDPRTNANRGYTADFMEQFSPLVFKPTTGDVIIFPGFLYHHVRAYNSKLRIAIPVDLFFYNEN